MNGRIITTVEASPRRKGIQPQHRAPLPNLGVLWWEDEPPELLALKASELTFGSVVSLRHIKTSLSKDTHKISHTLGTKAEAVIKNGPMSDPLWLWGTPQRGDQTWGCRRCSSHFGGAHPITRTLILASVVWILSSLLVIKPSLPSNQLTPILGWTRPSS